MTTPLRTFRDAQRFMTQRFPMTPEEQQECKRLDEQVHRSRVAHLEHHRELGTLLCWACDYPVRDPATAVPVKIANGETVLCCREYCASRVRDLIGAVEP